MFSLPSDGVLRAAPPGLKNTGKADRRKKVSKVARLSSVLNIARVGTSDICDICLWTQILLS